MDDDLKDRIFGKVNTDADLFKQILSKVPGFNGYIERQNRRASDKLLRETIANRLEEQWQRISRVQREFIAQGEIQFVDDLEAAALQLRTFIDRLRRASYGYSGLFDAIKINEEELARLYQYDAAMLQTVDEISRAIDNVEASLGSDGLPAAIRHLETVSRQAVEIFNRREEAVLGAGDKI